MMAAHREHPTHPCVRYRPYLGYRANQVREYVYRSIAADGVAPSYDMICAALGIGTKGEVSRIIGDLERRGLLRRAGRGRVRRIRLAPAKALTFAGTNE